MLRSIVGLRPEDQSLGRKNQREQIVSSLFWGILDSQTKRLRKWENNRLPARRRAAELCCAVSVFLQCQAPTGEPPLADIDAPVVVVPRVAGPAFGVRWNTVAGARMYEIQQTTSGFGMLTAHTFTDSTLVVATADTDGSNLFRVRGWTDHPTMGIAGPWSAVVVAFVDSAAIGLFAPNLVGPPRQIVGAVFSLMWSVAEGAVMYELAESRDLAFRTTTRLFFPSDTVVSITALRDGQFFFRVRGWNALPANGGSGSRWSAAASVFVGRQ